MRQRKSESRRGAAIIEFALTLPIFLGVTFATIDTCRVIYLRQSAKIAAFECARLSMVHGATPANLQTQCENILQSRGVQGFTLQQTDQPCTQFPNMVLSKFEVSVPADSNALGVSFLYQGQTFSESVTSLLGASDAGS